MAEPQETSPPTEALTSQLPDASLPRLGDLAAQHPAYTGSRADDIQAYRSLSVLALIGFGMSALYATVCLLLAVVALLSRHPMPDLGLSLLIPVTALILCLIARFRIARSEGTLAGGPLTSWGLVLSLLVSTGYAAYYGAVYLALK